MHRFNYHASSRRTKLQFPFHYTHSILSFFIPSKQIHLQISPVSNRHHYPVTFHPCALLSRHQIFRQTYHLINQVCFRHRCQVTFRQTFHLINQVCFRHRCHQIFRQTYHLISQVCSRHRRLQMSLLIFLQTSLA